MDARIEFYDSIDSTNAELMRRAKAGNSRIGDAVAAYSQSAGRGRRGNSFSSKRGGVYFSFVAENHPGALTTVKAGVAVAKALEEYGFSPEIKWVNDVLIDGKKVCGILAEAISLTSLCVVGIGINLRADALPEELQKIAAALDWYGTPPDAAELAERVIDNFFKTGTDGLIGEYKRYMTMLGKKVMLKQTGKVVTAADVTPLGELVVTCDDGSAAVLNSGEVSVIRL